MTLFQISANQLPVEIVRKPYRRTLKVRVKPNGLIQVLCSSTTKEKDIRNFLKEAESFLKKSYRKLFDLQTKLPHPFKSSTPWLPWLGQQLPIVLDAKARSPFIESDDLHIQEQAFNLQTLRKFYKKQAASILETRVGMWAETMQLFPAKVVVRGQKSRWGSCSSQGVINLNWKILIAPLDVIDYLIVHELSHLRHHNHSPSFWSLVERFQPHYALHEKWLRNNQHLAEFLDPDSEFYNPAVDREFIKKLFDIT